MAAAFPIRRRGEARSCVVSRPSRIRRAGDGARIMVGWMSGLVLLLLAAAGAAQTSAPVVLDKVVAVVNKHVILASDLDDEMRLSVLDAGQVGPGKPDAPACAGGVDQPHAGGAADPRRGCGGRGTEPAGSVARVQALRSQLPACVHRNCVSEAGWKAFLEEHGLTPERVRNHTCATGWRFCASSSSGSGLGSGFRGGRSSPTIATR